MSMTPAEMREMAAEAAFSYLEPLTLRNIAAGARDRILALPLPNTPAAERIKELWRDLLEKDDRTSPAEYPDMALITFDEFRDAIAALHPIPNTTAAPGEMHRGEVERIEAIAVEIVEKIRDDNMKYKEMIDLVSDPLFDAANREKSICANLARMKDALEKAREAYSEFYNWVSEQIAKATYAEEELGTPDPWQSLKDSMYDGIMASFRNGIDDAIDAAKAKGGG